MKIYISGPMTGLPDFNYPEFNRVAAMLRARDDVELVYNPAEWCNDGRDFDIRKAFADFCQFICGEADTIYLINGWPGSVGSRCELALANICGLKTITQYGDETNGATAS